MRRQRWPSGREIGVGIAEGVVCLSHVSDDGAVIIENHGAMGGQIDGAAIGERIRALQPSVAIVMPAPATDATFEGGLLLGTLLGLLSALGVAIIHAPLLLSATAPAGRVLH